MKATELIEHLRKLVEEHGDLLVVSSNLGNMTRCEYYVSTVSIQHRRYSCKDKSFGYSAWFFDESDKEELRGEKVISI